MRIIDIRGNMQKETLYLWDDSHATDAEKLTWSGLRKTMDIFSGSLISYVEFDDRTERKRFEEKLLSEGWRRFDKPMWFSLEILSVWEKTSTQIDLKPE